MVLIDINEDESFKELDEAIKTMNVGDDRFSNLIYVNDLHDGTYLVYETRPIVGDEGRVNGEVSRVYSAGEVIFRGAEKVLPKEISIKNMVGNLNTALMRYFE